MYSNVCQGSRRRKRTKFNKNQHDILTKAFEKDPYPDITVREELAKQIQIPEPRIQVWFQNKRARIPKSKKRPSAEVDTLAPGSHQGGLCNPECSSQQGLLPRSDSNIAHQSYAGPFSWGSEGSLDPASHSGHTGILGMNVASPYLETPARALGEPFGDFHCSPLGFSFEAQGGPFPPPQQPLSQVEGDGTGTHLGDPRPLMTCGDWAPQGWGQHPPSGEQLPWGYWQAPPALEPELVPQQALFQLPKAREQLPPPPPPSAQQALFQLPRAREQLSPPPPPSAQQALFQLPRAREQLPPPPPPSAQQALFQLPRAREQLPSSQPPSAQEHWLNPADPLGPLINLAELPAGHQDPFPSLPPSGDLGGSL